MANEGKTLLVPAPTARRARPGPGRPSRERVEERNRELLDQALDLFLERGFDGTTIDAITESLGMSRRTVYARYGDKDGLFRAALQGAVNDWVVPPERLRAAETDDLEATLLEVARLMVANVRSASGMRLTRIANTEVFRHPEIAEYLWQRTAKVALAWLSDLFARRLWPEPHPGEEAMDAAHAFLILVVEGAFQTLAWQRMPEAEFDRQIAYRTRLFLRGAARARLACDK